MGMRLHPGATEILDFLNTCDVGSGDLNFRPNELATQTLCGENTELPGWPDGHGVKQGNEFTRNGHIPADWLRARTAPPCDKDRWRTIFC